MSNSVLTEKLREHLAFTIIGLVLAALGTIGSLSLSFFLSYHDMAQSQYRKEEYVFQEFFAKQPRGLAFLQRESEARDRSLARSDRLIKSLGQPNSRRSSLSAIYESGLKDATQDLAVLSGYSPETTGLPNKYHESVQSMFRAETELWRCIGRHLSTLEHGRLSRAEHADLQARLLDVSFTSSLLASASEDMTFDQDLRKKTFEQRRDEILAERDRGWRWFNWSAAGVFVALLAFYFILRLTIPLLLLRNESTPAPMQAGDAGVKK
jgi:hypothetical protein